MPLTQHTKKVCICCSQGRQSPRAAPPLLEGLLTCVARHSSLGQSSFRWQAGVVSGEAPFHSPPLNRGAHFSSYEAAEWGKVVLRGKSCCKSWDWRLSAPHLLPQSESPRQPRGLKGKCAKTASVSSASQVIMREFFTKRQLHSTGLVFKSVYR